MSTGHLVGGVRAEAELYRLLGEGDTPELYEKAVTVDHSHSVPYAGGVSVDGKVVYIDHQLYDEIMSGRAAVKGMTPREIVQAIVEHEHTEWTVDVGDNAVDVYQPAHELATTKEHHFVAQLKVNPERYEEELKPALQRALDRPIENPPRDLWCGPYLDHADKHDKEILRVFRAKGVKDASKQSKFDHHYGYGENQCQDCAMFNRGRGPLRECDSISGLVRNTRWCDLWTERK